MALMVTGFTLSLRAQEISIAELKKYIVTMDSIETLKDQLSVTINNLSKGNDKITPQRFSELSPIITNETKLAEAKATPDEIAYVKKAAATRTEETKKFQKSCQAIIDDYIGEAQFNKIRAGLRKDEKLKKQYDSLTTKPIRP